MGRLTRTSAVLVWALILLGCVIIQDHFQGPVEKQLATGFERVAVHVLRNFPHCPDVIPRFAFASSTYGLSRRGHGGGTIVAST